MFDSEYLYRVFLPSVVLLVIYFPFGGLIGTILTEMFAYLTCVFFVLKRGKSQGYVWLNYAIWTFLVSYGYIVEFLFSRDI